MIVYKLTDKNSKTRVGKDNETQWGENVTHETNGVGDLCGPGWLHAYEDPLLAVLHNPIHANLDKDTMILWECETGDVIKKDGQMKLGTTKLTTIKQIPIPVITIEQRIKYAIFCALAINNSPVFIEWTNNWLFGKDRLQSAAAERAAELVTWAAERAEWAAWAERMADAAAWAMADAAAWAEQAVAWAARAAERAERSTWAATWAAAWAERAANAAAWAEQAVARAAERAAQAAQAADASLDLVAMTKQAMLP